VETHLVWVLVCPAVKAVVADVEITLGEPGNVALFEAASADGGEGAVPVEQIGGSLYGVEGV